MNQWRITMAWTSFLFWLEAEIILESLSGMDAAFSRPSLCGVIPTSLMIKVEPWTVGCWDWSRDHLHCWWLAGLHTLEPPCRWWGWHSFEEVEVSHCASLQVARSRHPLLEVSQGKPWGESQDVLSALQLFQNPIALNAIIFYKLWRSQWV